MVAAELAIVLCDALISEYGWISIGAAQRLFNITREDGIPNFFSSFQMLTVGAVILLITLVVREKTRGTSTKLVWGWAVICALFFYMGFDDATTLHERAGSIFSALVTNSDGDPNPGFFGQMYDSFPSYAWQLVLGPVVAICGLFVVVFLMRQLPTLQLKVLVLIAFGMFALAMGMDFVEGMDSQFTYDVADFFSTFPERAVHFSKSIEEFIEMAATTIFLFVFLKTLFSFTPLVTFEFDQPQ